MARLKEGFLRLMVTVCTNFMLWFGTAHAFFYSISKRPLPNVFKFIALLFCFPCFKAGNLCFKLAYLLNQRRALLIRRKDVLLGLDNYALEFEYLSLDNRSVLHIFHRLRHIHEGIERRRNDANCCYVNHGDLRAEMVNLTQNDGGA